MSTRYFEIKYMLKNSSNNATQVTVIQATDSSMARRIFEQQNPACHITSSPQDVSKRFGAGR